GRLQHPEQDDRTRSTDIGPDQTLKPMEKAELSPHSGLCTNASPEHWLTVSSVRGHGLAGPVQFYSQNSTERPSERLK
ncbi:MAG: hypothetical protein ACI8QS_003085, partial [Planctomycetota bacterium]